MRTAILIAASIAALLLLTAAGTPNGAVLTFNGDASYWTPSSAPTGVTIRPSEVLALNDAGYAWDDLRVPLVTLSKTAGTSPDFVELMDSTGTGGTGGVWAWSFRATQEDSLVAITQNPHNRAPGTEMEAHLHWTMATTTIGPTDGGSLAAVWQLECAYGGIGAGFNVVNTAAERSHSGTTATLHFTSHTLEVGQNITVAGFTETGGCTAGAYNGNFKISSLTATTVSYTSSVNCTEAQTGDIGGGTVSGYTIVRTGNGTVATDSKWKHLMTSFGTFRLANCTTPSCVWICTLSRPTSGGDIQESIPALELDWHYQVGRMGTATESM